MLDWKTWFGGALTSVKDFYVEHPNITMFGLAAAGSLTFVENGCL